jgi:hypothetical protein
MQNQNTLAARTVLLRYMEFRSEERWATGWRGDLEYALASLDDQHEIGAFKWLVEQAGGWWTWRAGDVMREFIEGSYAELQEQALAAGWAPSNFAGSGRTGVLVDDPVTGARGDAPPPDDPSWEAVARRFWGARYKCAQFLAIVIGLDALSIWLKWSDNTTVLVGAPVTVLVLLPDPPLWRMPLRSARHLANHEQPGPGVVRSTPEDQLSPR